MASYNAHIQRMAIQLNIKMFQSLRNKKITPENNSEKLLEIGNTK